MREQVIDISWSCEIDLRDYPPGDYLDLAAIADAIVELKELRHGIYFTEYGFGTQGEGTFDPDTDPYEIAGEIAYILRKAGLDPDVEVRYDYRYLEDCREFEYC